MHWKPQTRSITNPRMSFLKADLSNFPRQSNSKLDIYIHISTIPPAEFELNDVFPTYCLMLHEAIKPLLHFTPGVVTLVLCTRKLLAGTHSCNVTQTIYRVICSPLGLGWWYEHKITIYKTYLHIFSALIRKKMKHIKIITWIPSQRMLMFQLCVYWNHASQPWQKLMDEV